MNNKSIRWKQRFSNFEKAFKQLENAVNLEKLSELERSGLIQTFQYSFELSWKTLKDFLESEGISCSSPRESIKEAFKAGYIEEGHAWIEALDARNMLTHTYNNDLATLAEKNIKEKFYPFLKIFHSQFLLKKGTNE